MSVQAPRTSDYQLSMTNHAKAQIQSKGFDLSKIEQVYTAPAKVYPSGKRYPHQHRIVGKGLCLVGEFKNGQFCLVTVYKDRVVTPPRPDQLDTVQGREYAKQYEKGTYNGPRNITRPRQ